MAACDGFQPLVAATLDGALHAELAEPVLLTLLHLADHPKTRRRFRPFLELQAVLGPFTTLDTGAGAGGSGGPERMALLEVCVLLKHVYPKDRMTTPRSPDDPCTPSQASRRALLVLLRSWAGVTLLAAHEHKGLKALLHGVLGDGSVDPSVRLALFEVLESLLRPLVRRVAWMGIEGVS